MNDLKLDCALDLLRRLPPQTIERSLSDIVDLAPSLCDDLLSSVDQPLKVAKDANGRNYLLCDYNRDGDSYRSPWTNTYNPPLHIGPDGETGLMPSNRLRALEVEANAAFDQYRELYFEGGISSCYFWDSNKVDDDSFAGVVLFKKVSEATKSIKGYWDSIHVMEVQERSDGRSAHYKLTSTCMLRLDTCLEGSGMMSIGGSVTRQVEQDSPLFYHDRQPHIVNIGHMVEDKENQMRNELYGIYFGKSRDILNSLRSCQEFSDKEKYDTLAEEMVEELQGKNATV